MPPTIRSSRPARPCSTRFCTEPPPVATSCLLLPPLAPPETGGVRGGTLSSPVFWFPRSAWGSVCDAPRHFWDTLFQETGTPLATAVDAERQTSVPTQSIGTRKTRPVCCIDLYPNASGLLHLLHFAGMARSLPPVIHKERAMPARRLLVTPLLDKEGGLIECHMDCNGT